MRHTAAEDSVRAWASEMVFFESSSPTGINKREAGIGTGMGCQSILTLPWCLRAYRRSGKRNIPGGFGELDWHAWWVLTEA